MLIDSLNEFCDNVSVAASAGTALVGSQIYLGPTGQDIGNGEPIYLCIQTGATEIITGGSAGTILFKLASDSTASISTSTSTIHLTTPSYVTDDASANDSAMNAGGLIFFGALPMGTYEEYLGILCVTASNDVTAGTINAFLTKDPNGWKAYPDAL